MFNIILTDSALQHIKKVKAKNINKFLRITIEGGGCSGFQYVFALDDTQKDDDIIIYQENEVIFAKTDTTSAQLLNDSNIDFIEELGASYFKVNNPNAAAKCGCGSSFSI
jgi:iron-sulfur cluster assembly accessory protein